jgi:hypothetical protein
MTTLPTFQFVSFTAPQDAKVHQKRVRSHAARNPRARQKKVADFQRQRAEAAKHKSHLPDACSAYTERWKSLDTLASYIGNLAADPFQSFSRPLSMMEWSLIHHCRAQASDIPIPSDGMLTP